MAPKCGEGANLPTVLKRTSVSLECGRGDGRVRPSKCLFNVWKRNFLVTVYASDRKIEKSKTFEGRLSVVLLRLKRALTSTHAYKKRLENWSGHPWRPLNPAMYNRDAQLWDVQKQTSEDLHKRYLQKRDLQKRDLQKPISEIFKSRSSKTNLENRDLKKLELTSMKNVCQ